MSDEGLLDTLEVLLDTLDLNEGGVSDLRKEAETLVDGIDGFSVLSDFSLEFCSLLLSVKGLLLKVSSVLLNVILKLVQLVDVSLSGGDEDIVDHIVSVEEVSVGILDLLSQLGDVFIVVVGSSLEISVELVQFLSKFTNKLLDSINKLVEDTVGAKVELGISEDEVCPLVFLDLSEGLEVAVGP